MIPEPSQRSWCAPATPATAARNGDDEGCVPSDRGADVPSPNRQEQVGRAVAICGPARRCRPMSWISARTPKRRDVSHVETAASGCIHSQPRDTGGVSDEARRNKISKSPIAARALSIEPLSNGRCGLGSQASVSSMAYHHAKTRSLAGEGCCNFGIECMPRTTADHRCCIFGATEHPLEGGVSSHMNDPHCQRYLVAPRTPWLTLAVPTLGDVYEQWTHGRNDAEPIGEHPGHLAELSDVMLDDLGECWNAPCELTSAGDGVPPGGATARKKPAVISARDPNLLGDAYVVRRRRPEELRGDIGVGGASDVEQLARVVVWTAVSASTFRRSTSRIAGSVLYRPCSSGTAMPRSVAVTEPRSSPRRGCGPSPAVLHPPHREPTRDTAGPADRARPQCGRR